MSIPSQQLYEPLNVSVILAGVVVFTENNEIELSSDRDTMLSKLLAYRRAKLLKNYPNSIVQLLTTQPFNVGMGPRTNVESDGKLFA